MACQNAAVRPPWCQAGSREQGKLLTLDGGGLDQTGKVQEMQEKGRVEARNSSTDFHGEISPGDSRGLLGSGGPRHSSVAIPRSPWPTGDKPHCVYPLPAVEFGVPSFALSCPSSCFSLEGLGADADHFWKIVPLWSVPFLPLPGVQTNKRKAKEEQDFNHTDLLYNRL